MGGGQSRRQRSCPACQTIVTQQVGSPSFASLFAKPCALPETLVRIAESATGSRAKIAMADSDLPSLAVMGGPQTGLAPAASGGVCAIGVADRSAEQGPKSAARGQRGGESVDTR